MATPSPSINVRDLRDVLSGIRAGLRTGRLRLRGPLLDLELLTQRLVDLEQADTPINRSTLLESYLRGIAWKQLVSRSPSRHGLTSYDVLGRETDLLVEDFGRGDADLEAWSWLYYRFLAEDPLPVAEAALRLGFTPRTLERRLDRALELLLRCIVAETPFDRSRLEVSLHDLVAVTFRPLPIPLTTLVGRE